MLQNIPKEKILDIVRQGPTFPAKVAKQLGSGGDTVLIGAILSTLISTGEVRVSSVKIGGSPLYYVPDQESKLEDFIDHLNDKDRRVFKALKDAKVLQDSEQDPLTRVSLRTIKDFAKPFEITAQGQKVLFWRFYAVSIDDAESLSKSAVKVAQKVPVQTQPVVQSAAPPEATPVISQTVVHPEVKHLTVTEPEVVSVPKPLVHQEAQQILEESEESKHARVSKEHKDTKESAGEHKHVTHEHTTHEHTPKEHTTHEHVPHEHPAHEHHEKAKKAPKAEHVKPRKPSYDFLEVLKAYFVSKDLDMISKEKIKKTEYDIILKNHNTNEYIYCKAKDKSSVNEGDLAPAMIFAQSKKMSCLFVTTGELSKKAELMLGKELSALRFERIVVGQSEVSQ